MTPAKRLITYQLWLPRLADPADAPAASEALRNLFYLHATEGTPQGLTRDEEDALRLQPYIDAISTFPPDELDHLIPQWIQTLLTFLEESKRRQELRVAALRSDQPLPEITLAEVSVVPQLISTLQAAGPRLDPHLPLLLSHLGTSGRDTHSALCETLENAGPAIAAATEGLLRVLQRDGVWEYPSHIARALANAGKYDPSILPTLQSLLTAADTDLRSGIMHVISHFGPQGASTSSSLLSLRNGSESDRCSLISALADQRNSSPEYLGILEEAMRGESPDVRLAAVFALSKLTPDPDRFVPLLIRALDIEEYVHDYNPPDEAIEALGNYGSSATSALPRLRGFLTHPFTGPSAKSKLVRNAIASINPLDPILTSTPIPHPRRTSPLPDTEPLFPVGTEQGLAYLDTQGHLVFELEGREGSLFSDGRAIINQNGHTLAINRSGQILFGQDFDDLKPFSEGLAPFAIEQDNKLIWGFVNTAGVVVIPPRFSSVLPFSEGLAGVELGREHDVPLSKDGFVSADVPGRRGFINREGHIVTPCQYHEVSSFHQGLAAVCLRAKSRPNQFWEGRITFYDHEFGYIDRTGRVVIPGPFATASDFHEGLAAVTTGLPIIKTRAGYINTQGEIVIPLRYTAASNFSNGIASVSERGKRNRKTTTLISPTGQHLANLPLTHIGPFSSNLAPATNANNLSGYITPAGHFVIPPQFDSASPFHHGLAYVSRAEWHALITLTGTYAYGPTTHPTADPFAPLTSLWSS